MHIKNSIIFLCFLSICFLLNSCLEVRYVKPMPLKGKKIKKNPKKFIGVYYTTTSDEKKIDTLYVNKKNFYFTSEDIIYNLTEDKYCLKKYNDSTYIFSILEQDSINNIDSWTIVPITYSKNEISLYAYSEDENEKETLNLLKNITPIKHIEHLSKIPRSYYLINPTTEEFKEIMSEKIYQKIVILKKME